MHAFLVQTEEQELVHGRARLSLAQLEAQVEITEAFLCETIGQLVHVSECVCVQLLDELWEELFLESSALHPQCRPYRPIETSTSAELVRQVASDRSAANLA